MHILERLHTTKPSFLGGLAAIIYCRTPKHVYIPSEAAADENAIRSDWLEIGRDMHKAITAYERSP
jgi:hypothetical protein